MDTKNDVNSHNLVSGATKMLTVDAAYSTEEEQKAALKFLDWLVYSDYGQNFLVNTCSLISAFSNNTQEPEAALSASVSEFVKMDSLFIGIRQCQAIIIQKLELFYRMYISGAIDRAELISEVTEYWKKCK